MPRRGAKIVLVASEVLDEGMSGYGEQRASVGLGQRIGRSCGFCRSRSHSMQRFSYLSALCSASCDSRQVWPRTPLLAWWDQRS